MNTIRMFDNFGYTPQFFIGKDSKYKSFLGGIISLFFIIISIAYSINQIIYFFKNLDIVQTSRNIVRPSNSYDLSSKDLYFGVGLIDRNRIEYNVSMFPYLKFELDYLFTDKNSQNQTTSILQLGPCDISKFFPLNDYEILSKREKDEIKKKIPYYICPQGDFNFKMVASNIIEGEIFIQVTISINDSSLLNQTHLDFSKTLVRTNFIYKNMFINYENRKDPYSSFIDRSFNSLDLDYEKNIVNYIVPFEMADDNNLFGNGEFTGVDSDYSDQDNGTIFITSPGYNYFVNIKNRSQQVISKNNQPLLSLCRMRLMLNPTMTITLRTYPKFTDFLAGLTSILSSGLKVIAIFMVHFNSVQGFNEMVESFYTHGSIKNINVFNRDLKDTIQYHKHSSDSKRNNKEKNLVIESENISHSFNKINKFKENFLKFNENNKLIRCNSDIGKINIVDKMNFSKNNLDSEMRKEIDLNFRLKRDSKLERILDSFLEDNRKFSLIDYFNQLCKNQSKRTILYGYGIKNLTEILDIRNYLKNHLEINLIKQVLFDEYQSKIFNTISPVIGFKLMFEDNSKNKVINLSEYNKIEFNDFFDFLVKILERKNIVDKKILDFIKHELISHI